MWKILGGENFGELLKMKQEILVNLLACLQLFHLSIDMGKKLADCVQFIKIFSFQNFSQYGSMNDMHVHMYKHIRTHTHAHT